MAVRDTGRTARRRHRRRDDAAAAAADDDAPGRQQFEDLHDSDPADVVAAADCLADRPASRRAGAAGGRRRRHRIGVGGGGRDALRLALYR